MSFGVSISDVYLLVTLAWRSVQNTRSAGSDHIELSCAALSLHNTLKRLEIEVKNPKSLLNKPGDTNRQEIEAIGSGCKKILTALDKVLERYSKINGGKRGLPKTWQRFRFGNEEMTLKDIQAKMTFYTSALSLYLNMVSVGSSGRIESQMEAAGGDLKELKSAVNNITAHLMSNAKEEGSRMTAYTDDDGGVWREFRRCLVKQGFKSSLLHKHKATIQSYVNELGSRGLMDEPGAAPPVSSDDTAAFKIDEAVISSTSASDSGDDSEPARQNTIGPSFEADKDEGDTLTHESASADGFENTIHLEEQQSPDSTASTAVQRSETLDGNDSSPKTILVVGRPERRRYRSRSPSRIRSLSRTGTAASLAAGAVATAGAAALQNPSKKPDARHNRRFPFRGQNRSRSRSLSRTGTAASLGAGAAAAAAVAALPNRSKKPNLRRSRRYLSRSRSRSQSPSRTGTIAQLSLGAAFVVAAAVIHSRNKNFDYRRGRSPTRKYLISRAKFMEDVAEEIKEKTTTHPAESKIEY